MLMNTDPNHDPQDPNPVIGEDQAGVAPGQASAAPSDQTPEPSTDFVVMVDGQTVESEAGQDSPSSPIGEEPQEVAVIGTDSSVSRSDTPQAGQQSDPSRVDAQPAALHTDSQPGTAETDPQSVAPPPNRQIHRRAISSAPSVPTRRMMLRRLVLNLIPNSLSRHRPVRSSMPLRLVPTRRAGHSSPPYLVLFQ